MFVAVILALCLSGSYGQYLEVSGLDLMYNGEKVFLSGMNIAWDNYGNDFGNGQYDCCTGTTLESWLQQIAAAGGNSVRKWALLWYHLCNRVPYFMLIVIV